MVIKFAKTFFVFKETYLMIKMYLLNRAITEYIMEMHILF